MKTHRPRHTRVKREPRREKKPAARLDVAIERILPGGLGLAHSDGLTLLVGLAAPGDRVRVRIERVQGRLAFASITEILEPSADRVQPPCPYFGRCGGCDFQQLNYEAQLAAKVAIIRDCLHRIAKIDLAGEIPITASPSPWNYRSRAQWQLDPQEMRLGYFERGSHRVCDVASCAVLVPELETTFESLRAKMKNGELSDGFTELLAAAGDDADISLSPGLPEYPTREVSRIIGGHRYRFTAEGFFQTSHDLLEQLIGVAIAGASGETAIDLYCGVGLFTLPLAQQFKKVYGVEANSTSIYFARRNVADAGLDNVFLDRATVANWLSEHVKNPSPIDFVVLDPPRTGAEASVIKGIAALRPKNISYVSCDPATLARDLKDLTEAGYGLESVTAFDMFPQTHHVETIARLVKW